MVMPARGQDADLARSRYPLSLPFVVYSLAFLILGFSPFSPSADGKAWLQRVATGLYAAASSSGSISFAFNFGTDGGSTVNAWVFRLAIVQGLTQVYTIGLWAWGSLISDASADALSSPSLGDSRWLLALCGPIALFLCGVAFVSSSGPLCCSESISLT
jgi:alpha-1,3-glucan synthase